MKNQTLQKLTIVTVFKSVIFFVLIISFYSLTLLPSHSVASEEWLYFSRDKYSPDTKYYYDLESVRYFPDNHSSAWMKVRSSGGEQFFHTEVSCSSALFRIVQPPPKDIWDIVYKKGPNKTQYVVSGWFEIPPDSEVNILRRILCNNPKKNFN